MPIDLIHSIKKTSQWAFGSPLLNTILGSSLFVSILIALIMVLLVMILYPAKKGTPFSVVCKMFIYMFFTTLLIVFLHDGVIVYLFKEEEDERNDKDLMRGMTLGAKDPVYGNNSIPIMTAPVMQAQTQIQAPTQVQTPEPKKEIISPIEGGKEMLIGVKPVAPRTNPYKL